MLPTFERPDFTGPGAGRPGGVSQLMRFVAGACRATSSALLSSILAEAVGFEPTMPFQACPISSRVQSTTLPCLRGTQTLRVAETMQSAFAAESPQFTSFQVHSRTELNQQLSWLSSPQPPENCRWRTPGRGSFRPAVAEIVSGTSCPGPHARRGPAFSRAPTEPPARLRARMAGVHRSAVYRCGRVCGSGRPL